MQELKAERCLEGGLTPTSPYLIRPRFRHLPSRWFLVFSFSCPRVRLPRNGGGRVGKAGKPTRESWDAHRHAAERRGGGEAAEPGRALIGRDLSFATRSRGSGEGPGGGLVLSADGPSTATGTARRDGPAPGSLRVSPDPAGWCLPPVALTRQGTGGYVASKLETGRGVGLFLKVFVGLLAPRRPRLCH